MIKTRRVFIILPFIIVLVFSLSLFILNKIIVAQTVVSPISALSLNILSAQTDHYFWQPGVNKDFDSPVKAPEITAKSAIVYDTATNLALYKKNINLRLPIASLTKIMTAVVALENEDFDQVVKVSKKAASIGENSMGLSEGEILNVKDLLYGLILPSGNDAAQALAEGGKLGRKNFIYLMNKKAQDLGLSNTHFTNPSGLEGDGNQYSSVYDLLVITEYGLRNKNFSKIVSTVEYDIPSTSTHKTYYFYNDTSLLTTYPGVKGVKIGYTDEAGLCMVTYLEYKNHKIIAVLLNSPNRREEMKELLDYSLRSQGVEPPPHS